MTNRRRAVPILALLLAAGASCVVEPEAAPGPTVPLETPTSEPPAQSTSREPSSSPSSATSSSSSSSSSTTQTTSIRPTLTLPTTGPGTLVTATFVTTVPPQIVELPDLFSVSARVAVDELARLGLAVIPFEACSGLAPPGTVNRVLGVKGVVLIDDRGVTAAGEMVEVGSAVEVLIEPTGRCE